jgi:hypothetical protein
MAGSNGQERSDSSAAEVADIGRSEPPNTGESEEEPDEPPTIGAAGTEPNGSPPGTDVPAQEGGGAPVIDAAMVVEISLGVLAVLFFPLGLLTLWL